jgi:hypothetical protein
MLWSKKTWLGTLLWVFLLAVVVDAFAADRGRNSCRRGDRLRIEDLDVSPDPVTEGQRIRMWRVKIHLDGNRDCDTEIEIREGREVVASDRLTLRPGTNQVNIRPDASYEFRGKEHCFRVVADLDGTRSDVDAYRRFCAQRYTGWSMRETNDPQRRGDLRGLEAWRGW